MSGETESTQAKGNQASLITKSLPAPSRPMTCSARVWIKIFKNRR